MDFLDGLKKEFQIANGVTLIFGLILLIYPGFSSRVLHRKIEHHRQKWTNQNN